MIVYALDAQKGTARWQVKLSNIPTRPAQPVIVNDVLYAVEGFLMLVQHSSKLCRRDGRLAS